MLVLGRYADQAIVIDPTQCPTDELGRITVMVVEVRGNKVRLGFDAPARMPVHRQEIQEAIDRRAEFAG